MSNYNDIIQEINTNLPDNDEQLITAEKLRNTLIDVSDYFENSNSEQNNVINFEYAVTDYNYEKVNDLSEFIDLEVSETPTEGYYYNENGELVADSNWEAWEIDLTNYSNQTFWYKINYKNTETAYILLKNENGEIISKLKLNGGSTPWMQKIHSDFVYAPIYNKILISNRKAYGDAEFKTYGDVKYIPQVIDDLESESTNDALSANQGRVLEGEISILDNTLSNLVVDNLTSEDPTKALSAKQGNVLKDLVDGKIDKVENAVSGNFAEFDSNGNITDSGINGSSFVTPEQLANVTKFKGWFDSANNLPSGPTVGDYAYVKGATASDPTKIYECTTNGNWTDSGRTVDTSNVQSFTGGQAVNTVTIVDNLKSNSADDVLAAKQGKELSVRCKRVTFEGEDNNFVSYSYNQFYCLKDHIYKIYVDNTTPDWSNITYTSAGYVLLSFRNLNYNNEQSTTLYERGCNDKVTPLNSYYILKADKNGFIRIVGRANVGETINFVAEDITEITTKETITGTFKSGAYTFTVGSAPSYSTTSSYKYCKISNLAFGDRIQIYARVGTSYAQNFIGKIKNGVVVDKINASGTTTDWTITVDNTFDEIIINNYNGYVDNPTATVYRYLSGLDMFEATRENLQDQIDDISKEVFEEVNILCFGNSFTQDTVGYLPWILREAEPNKKFNVYFTYMGGMPIAQCLAYIGGDGYSTIARNSNGNISLKYENHGGWDRIYSWNSQTETWTTPSSGSTNYHKSYTLYKCPWNADAWTSQSEPDIETTLNILGEGHKWDLITIQQSGSFNYLSWNWHFKPYIYELYARLKNRLNYEFKIGYIMTHSSYSNSPETLLTRYSNGILTNTKNIMENTPTEVLLPYATAVQNARTTYLTRFGSNVYDGAKLKNGFVTEIITRGSSNINITCDGTFDAIILNNESGTVSSPVATLNGNEQTWTSGTGYNLYVGCRPISRSDSTYKSLWLTGLTNGDVITSTSNTADNGVALLTDSAHLNDGIGCLTATYANAMGILNMIGSKKTILGSQIYPNSSWISQHNVPGTSSVYGLNKYNIWLAQQCAIMASKYPLQLTDMVEKGMCKAIEVYINNNNVISSNPILSADLNGSWETTLSVPDGMTISDVKVYMDAEDITSTTYDSSTQKVSVSNITSKVTIEVTLQ